MTFDPFSAVQRVALELSNRCVYAAEHALCPAHRKREEAPSNLPGSVVEHVVNTLALRRPGFAGFFYFHLYNEPLADPRLIGFVGLVRKRLPAAVVQITTSGWNLDQVLLDELAVAGARAVRVSIYSATDLARIRKLRPRAGLKLIFSDKDPGTWKNVLRPDIPAVYEGPARNLFGRCRAPLRQLCVSSTGEVILCCQDWARTVVFGNLRTVSLEEVLRSDPVINAYLALSKGGRIYDPCKRCRHTD